MKMISCFIHALLFFFLWWAFSSVAGRYTDNTGQDKSRVSNQVLKNLSTIIVRQQAAGIGANHSQFYPNGVQLEPFTVHLCGTEKMDNYDPMLKNYNKVDPKEAYKMRFFAGSDHVLDSNYNADNRIPLIHSSHPPTTDREAHRPDAGEPTISSEVARRSRIMLIYDQTSNYYRVYTSMLSMHLGGVDESNSRRYANFYTPMESGTTNACYPDEAPGVGETVVHLYLLATGGLNNITNMTISAYARADKTGNADQQGHLEYELKRLPVYNSDSFTLNTLTKNGNLRGVTQSYSFFSSMVADRKQIIRGETGGPICVMPLGAPFHGLFWYSDHDERGMPCALPSNTRLHSPKCQIEGSCAKKVAITALRSKGIPLHDMFSPTLMIGEMCPNKASALHAYVTYKPLLHSASQAKTERDDETRFSTSYQGGVGAYFYPKRPNEKGANLRAASHRTMMGGETDTFYFFSYVEGATPKPGTGCGRKNGAFVEGHDMYGNYINLTISMANGDTKAAFD